MKVYVPLPVDILDPAGEFLSPAMIRKMARSLEDYGFDGCSVTDHPVPTTRWLNAGGHHAQDPFTILSFVAAVTERIKLQTAILVLPYRNPFLVARAAATMEAIAPDRLVLGVGLGYLKGEYKALGIDFDRRNEIFDTNLEALIQSLTHNEFTFEGPGFTALGNSILPRPPRLPPIWIGGNSRRAIRRAARFGSAWSPFSMTSSEMSATARTASVDDLSDLSEKIVYLHEQANLFGRVLLPDVFLDSVRSPTPGFTSAEWIERLLTLKGHGITGIGWRAEGRSRSEWHDVTQKFAEEVLPFIRG